MRRWILAAALSLLWTPPAGAQEEAPAPDDGDRLRLVDEFRDWRGQVGTRFEESRLGAYVNEHMDVALEYRFYQFLDEGPPRDARRTRHEGRVEVEYERDLWDDAELFVDMRVWLDDDDYAVGAIDSLEDDEPKRRILDLTEAYVDLFFDDVDLRLGKQIVKWGKADVFNPTDNVNPDDFSTLTEDEPIGVVAGRLNYYYEDWGFEFVVVPTFTPTRLPPRGTRFDLIPEALPLPLLDRRERPDTIHDVQYGVRANTTYQGWDFSLSWYDGVNHFLNVEPVFLPTPPFAALEPVNHRLRVLGLNFATTFDQLGLHGEGAWYQSDGHREDDYLVYVLGLDYTWTNVVREHDIFAILEYAGEHVVEQSTSPVSGSGLQRAFSNTFAANITYEVSAFLEYHFRTIYNFDGPDNVLVEPEVEYAVNDNFTVTAGFDIIHGTGGETLFDVLSENDQFYFKGRYTF